MNESASPSQSTGSFAVRDWCLAVLVAGVLGFGVLMFPPVLFNTPEELLGVDIYSPPDLQAAAAENALELKWKNAIAYFVQLALCFSLVGLVCKLQRVKVFGICVLVAVLAGALAGVMAVVMRDTLNGVVQLPGVQQSIRGMVDDMLVYGVSSAIFVVPVAVPWLLSGTEGRVQRGITAMIAGLVGGACYPFVSSLLSTAPTNLFPPGTPLQKALWIGLVAVVVSGFVATAGPKKTKIIEEQPATE